MEEVPPRSLAGICGNCSSEPFCFLFPPTGDFYFSVCRVFRGPWKSFVLGMFGLLFGRSTPRWYGNYWTGCSPYGVTETDPQKGGGVPKNGSFHSFHLGLAC